ncbi:MAG: hypothetical protein JWM27_2730 [Gemmatimonadetes bacterium]|nr:hypothetical protein [Gemmatimonadota bacterium]
MTTLLLQQLSAALMLLFGILCLRVSRHAQGPAEHRTAWLVTGQTFTWMGAVATLHDLFADWAFVSGAGSRVMDEYLRWNAVGNDSRAVLSIGLTLLIFLLVTRWRGPGQVSLRRITLWNGGFFLLGGVIGLAEQAHSFEEHAAWLTYIEGFAVLLLFGCLLVAVARDSVDALLWLALVVYALRDAVMISVVSDYSMAGVLEVWVPAPSTWQGILTGTNLMLCCLAAVRLRLARRGMEVPPLFELGRWLAGPRARGRRRP